MLKPKSLIFTLSLVPFLLASLQLTSEGGSTTPGGPSGNVLPSPPSIPQDPVQPTQPPPPNPQDPVQQPQPEPPNPEDPVQQPNPTPTPTGKTTPGGSSGGSGVTFIPNAESIIVTREGQSATLAVTQEVQSALNQLVPNIVQVLGTSANTTDLVTLVLARPGVTEAAARITAALTSAGISPQLAIALVNALNGLFSPSTASSPGAMLVSTKDWKGNNTVAQAGAAFSVNIDKLSAAITAYNGIVIESKPPTLKRLSQDASFVGIGRTLKQLRNAIP